MMSNSQAQKGKVKPCPNGCGKDIYFESRFGENGQLIMKDKDPTKPRWWMMEDVSKQSHQCPNNKFKNVAVEKTQDLIQKDLLQPRTMDVADFSEQPLRARAELECKFIFIIEEVVKNFFEKQFPKVETNPMHIGMYVKLIYDCVERNN